MSDSPLLDRIRAATGDRAVSLARLARASGIHVNTLQHWAYRDRCPNRRTMTAVAAVLGVPQKVLDPECWARRTVPRRGAGTHTVARGAAHELRRLRRRAGLKQAEVAAALGTNVSTVGSWEQGIARPGSQWIEAMARLYGVDGADVVAAAAPRAYSPIDGAKLRGLRLSRGWSQEELGRRVGATGSAVSLWEAGRRAPTREMWTKLSEVLGLDAGALAPDADQPRTGGDGGSR